MGKDYTAIVMLPSPLPLESTALFPDVESHMVQVRNSKNHYHSLDMKGEEARHALRKTLGIPEPQELTLEEMQMMKDGSETEDEKLLLEDTLGSSSILPYTQTLTRSSTAPRLRPDLRKPSKGCVSAPGELFSKEGNSPTSESRGNWITYFVSSFFCLVFFMIVLMGLKASRRLKVSECLCRDKIKFSIIYAGRY